VNELIKGDRVAKKSDVEVGLAKFYKYLEPSEDNKHKIVKCMCNTKNFEEVLLEELYPYTEAKKILSTKVFKNV